MRGVTRQHPSLTRGQFTAPGLRALQMQRPNGTRRLAMHLTQKPLGGIQQGAMKVVFRHGLQLLRVLGCRRPDHRAHGALRPFQRQQGHDVGPMTGLPEPLQGLLAMRLRSAHAAGQGMLVIGQALQHDTQLITGGTVAAFADHGQGGWCGFWQACDVGALAHRLIQQVFQRGHVHNGGQPQRRGRLKPHLSTCVAPYLHALQRRGVLDSRPAAHRGQQGA